MRGVTVPMRKIVSILMERVPRTAPVVAGWSWLWQPGWDQRHHEKFYRRAEDPYGFDSPGEQSKYRETLSLLDDRRYDRALEVGAGEGHFTEMLLPLCERLVAAELSEVALARARERLGDQTGLTFERRTFPLDLPEGSFDLIVLSDVAYYWTPEVFDRGLALIAERLRPGGRMLLLHYRGPFGAPISGDHVHDRAVALAGDLGLETRPALEFAHRGPEDAGYRVDLLTRPAAS